jgi:hypothetical protein
MCSKCKEKYYWGFLRKVNLQIVNKVKICSSNWSICMKMQKVIQTVKIVFNRFV